VRRKNEIVVIPVTTIVRQGNTTTPVHGDLPRANRFIKNTRDQRASDLPARITPLTQPDCQEIYHVISELSDRRKRPVPEHRADMRAQNALIRLLRQFRACVTAYPLLAFIPEPRATQLGSMNTRARLSCAIFTLTPTSLEGCLPAITATVTKIRRSGRFSRAGFWRL